MRHWVVLLTFFLLSVDAILAIAWCVTQCAVFEPYITMIALFATITGLFIDRWLANLERRSELLYVLLHEVASNHRFYINGEFNPEPLPNFTKHYVRLVTTAANAAISSGTFNGIEDADLFRLTYDYRESCNRLNSLVDWIERIMINMSSMPGQESNSYAVIQERLKSSIQLNAFLVSTSSLIDLLLVQYWQESGIVAGDLLFVPPDHPQSPARRRTHPIRAWTRRIKTAMESKSPGMKTWAKKLWKSYVVWLHPQVDRKDDSL